MKASIRELCITCNDTQRVRKNDRLTDIRNLHDAECRTEFERKKHIVEKCTHFCDDELRIGSYIEKSLKVGQDRPLAYDCPVLVNFHEKNEMIVSWSR